MKVELLGGMCTLLAALRANVLNKDAAQSVRAQKILALSYYSTKF